MSTSRPPKIILQRARHPSTLGATHAALLQVLLRYHYLTSEMACRLLYSPGSLSYVRSAFKVLHDVGLVEPVFLGRQGAAGSSKKVYTLSGRGLSYLQRQGFDVCPRYHGGEQTNVGIWHL